MLEAKAYVTTNMLVLHQDVSRLAGRAVANAGVRHLFLAGARRLLKKIARPYNGIIYTVYTQMRCVNLKTKVYLKDNNVD